MQRPRRRLDFPGAIIEIRDDLDAGTGKLSIQVEVGADRVLHVERLRRLPPFPGEVEQLPDELDAPLDRTVRLGENLQVRPLWQSTAEQLSCARDGPEHVVDVVNDVADEGSDQLQLLDVRELRPRLGQLFAFAFKRLGHFQERPLLLQHEALLFSQFLGRLRGRTIGKDCAQAGFAFGRPRDFALLRPVPVADDQTDRPAFAVTKHAAACRRPPNRAVGRAKPQFHGFEACKRHFGLGLRRAPKRPLQICF